MHYFAYLDKPDMSPPMHDHLLYKQYFEPVKRYLERYTGNNHAEELAQEVFIKVIKNREQFRGESSEKNWIYRIATNTAKDFLKSRYKKDIDKISETDLEHYDSSWVDEASPEALKMTSEMNQCIQEFIHRLPDQYATALVLSELEGRNIKEISEILDLSQNATKVRLHRARARLRDEIEIGCIITTTCDNRMRCERKE